MPVNVALGHVSNAFMIAALVIYSFSVVAFAGDFAFGRPRRAAAAARAQQTRDRTAELASVGAAGGPAAAEAGDSGSATGPEAAAKPAGRACAARIFQISSPAVRGRTISKPRSPV